MISLPMRQNPTVGGGVPMTPFLEPWLSILRRAMTLQAGKPVLMSGYAMTSADRDKVRDTILFYRQKIIAGPGDRVEISAELTKLVAAFPIQEQSDLAAALRVEAFFEALDAVEAPAWAVRAARLRIIRGDTDLDRRFAPTPPQLADLVRSTLRPFHKDLNDLDLLSRIEPEREATNLERKRIGEGFDQLANGVCESVDTGDDERKEHQRCKLAEANQRGFERECEKNGLDPAGGATPELLKSIEGMTRIR